LNRSRGLLFGFVLAGLVLTGVLLWLGAGRASDDVGGGVLSARSGETGVPHLPEAVGDEPGALPQTLDTAAAADAGVAGSSAAPETRWLSGVLRMDDGSALPADLRVFTATRAPPPRLFSIRDIIGVDGDSESISATFGGDVDVPASEAPAGEEARAGLDGRFELTAPATRVWLGVRSDEVFVSPGLEVAAGATGELDVLLERGGVIEGRVLDAQGQPVERAGVRAATPFDPYSVLDNTSRMAALDPVYTDAEGRFRFRQVPAGLGLQVVALRPGVTFGRQSKMLHAEAEPGSVAEPEAADGPALQPARADVSPLQPGELRAIELVLQPASIVRGRVKLPDGRGLPDARVSLRRTSISMKDISIAESFGDKDTTDAEGRFEFADVSAGSYAAILAQEGYRLARVEDFEVEPGGLVEGLELLAEKGLTVSGRVLDSAGAPLVDVEVHGFPKPSLISFGATFERDLYPEVDTAEDGSFTLSGYEPGDVRLRCSRKDLRVQTLDVDAGATGVEVRMEGLTTLSGIVISLADGEPVSDFSVGAQPSEGLFQPGDFMGAEAEAGFERLIRMKPFHDREDGTFTLEGVVPGSYEVSVKAKGFGEHLEPDVQVDAPGRRGLVIMLEPECAVSGLVVDSRSGVPLSGAIVRVGGGGGVMEMMSEMGKPAAQERSDGQGRFRLGGLPQGTLRLTIEHKGHRALGVPEFALARGEARDLGTLALSTGAVVYGTVYDTLGPAADVPVMVSSPTGTTLKRTASDSRGNFRVEGLGAGTYSVMRADFNFDIGGDSSPTSMLEGLVVETVTLAEDEERRVDLRVQTEGGVRLVGTVKDAAGPVAGAMVTLMPESAGGKPGWASTDKEGAYGFGHVTPGRYGLTVMPTDSVGSQTGQPTSAVFASVLLGAQPEQRHDVELPGGILNGVVLSKADGKPVPEVRLVLERTDAAAGEVAYVAALGGRVAEVYADESGHFRFRHLPGGEYAVIAGGRNILGMGAAGWAQKRVEDLTVVEGSPGFTVKVEVEPAAVVAGTVRDPAGVPLEGTGVWVLDASNQPRSRFSEESSNGSGGYEIGDLPNGACSLAFMDGSHALTIVSDVTVRVGEETALDVTLPPGVPLRLDLNGRTGAGLDVGVSGPGGWLPSRLTSFADLAGMGQVDGTLGVGTYAPGNYHVTVMSGAEQLFDGSVTLVLGSGAKVLQLPAP
jgi:Carboxypeptidase regulatory-like domain